MIAERDHQLFAELLRGKQRIVVATHVNPDGDAIGSEVGLTEYLRGAGHSVEAVNHDPTPEFLRFLEEPQERAEVYDAARHDALLRGADRILLVDNSAPDRLGRMEAIMRECAARVFCIDHHPTRGTPWKHNILEEGAPATSGMIYELTTRQGFKPSARAAMALYAGLATDTGFFRFNSTTSRAHGIAGELLAAGADPALCYQEIYERNAPAHTRLLGRALSDLRISASGAVASIRITKEMVDQYAASNVDTSEMTTVLLATDRVRIALLFREMEDGKVKVSLRSKGALDVHNLASAFGGGGHRNASGIVVPGPLADVEARVLDAAAKLAASGA